VLLKKARRKGFRGCIQPVVAGSWQGRSDAGCESVWQPSAGATENVQRGFVVAVVGVAQCCLSRLDAAPALGLLLSAVSGARKRLEPRLTSDF
jgi:hypothetical protein